MYQLRTKGAKRDPIKRWALPDRVFFACGACHILAYAFLRAYPDLCEPSVATPIQSGAWRGAPINADFASSLPSSSRSQARAYAQT
jgi:hypothetical protein